MRRVLKVASVFFILLLAGAQFVRPERVNPPAVNGQSLEEHARVRVGHHRHVVRDPREGRDVLELRDDLRVHLVRMRPQANRDVSSIDCRERHF